MIDTTATGSAFHPRHPILIVDDEESILLAIDTTLRMAGFSNVITCGDSRSVSGILSEQSVELILLDLNMPHVHGERLLDEINRGRSRPLMIPGTHC